MKQSRTSRPSASTPVIVVANRAPFELDTAGEGGLARRRASGLVTALEPLIESCSGTWVAHGSGNADDLIVGDRGRRNVPPANPTYRVRCVPLSERQLRGYYHGFSNEGLWPLCHDAGVQPVFRASDFSAYQDVNALFAAAVAEEASGGSPIVLVQDYHFALAPRAIRNRLHASAVVSFWHTPWPRPSVFRACPWAAELLDGILGSNIAGFQTDDDAQNFLGAVESILDAVVDWPQRAISYQRRTTKVGTYPVGVAWGNAIVRATPPPATCRAQVFRDLELRPGSCLVVGVDRLDYTKGINEKFLVVERLLELRPDLRGRLVLVQIAAPSRECLPAYRAARMTLLATAARVNARFGTESYQPIRLLESHHESADVYRFYRAADVCHVNSLHDGMNLVAKEFAAARDDERGVLVLSSRTGAARQLRAALLVDPGNVDQSAELLARALDMPAVEQSKRMRQLRANVESFSADWWAHTLLRDALAERHRGHRLASVRAYRDERSLTA